MKSIRDFLINLGLEENNEYSDEYMNQSTFENKDFRLFVKYYIKCEVFDICFYDSTEVCKATFFSERLLKEFVLIKKHEYEECCFLNFIQEVEKITNIRKYYNSYGFVNDVIICNNKGAPLIRIRKKHDFLLEICLVALKEDNLYPIPTNMISSKDNNNLFDLKERIVDCLTNSNNSAFEGFLYEDGAEVSIYP